MVQRCPLGSATCDIIKQVSSKSMLPQTGAWQQTDIYNFGLHLSGMSWQCSELKTIPGLIGTGLG
jgi:hypothetical protein